MAKTPKPIPRQSLRYRGRDHDGNFKYSYVPRVASVGVEGASQSRCPFVKSPRATILAALAAGNREILAHYFPPFPLSLDNAPLPDYYENYLTPDGAGDPGGHGGYLRERPQYQAPVLDQASPGDGEYEDAQLREEVMWMSRLGVSVITPDVLGTGSPQLARAQRLAQLLDNEFQDMKIAPMLDMNSGVVAADANSAILHASYFKDYVQRWNDPDDGRMIVSCFETSGPNFNGTQWGDVIAGMASTHGVDINLLHVGQTLGTPTIGNTLLTDLEAHTPGYAARMKYVGAWGAGYANYGATLTTIKGQVEGGVTYTQTMDFAWPITPSVVRAKDAWYQGAENFDTLINQLDALVAGDPGTWPRFVNLVTWNDLSEATHLIPTPTNGGAYYRLVEYYLQMYATGVAPVIDSDTIFYSYRSQLTSATPVGGAVQTVPFAENAGVFDDQIQMLVFLKADATLEIEFNGVTTQYAATAGIDSFKVPAAAAGAPIFRVIRGNRIVEEVAGSTDISDTYDVQDPTYFTGTSRNTPMLGASANDLFVSAPWRYGNYASTGVDATLTHSELESPFPRLGVTERPPIRFESFDDLVTTGVGWSFLGVGYSAEAFEIAFDLYVESVDGVTAGLRMVAELFDGAVGIGTTSVLPFIDIAPGAVSGSIGYIDAVDADQAVAAIDIQTWYRVIISFTGVEAGATFDLRVYSPSGYSDEGQLLGEATSIPVRSPQTTDVNNFAWRNAAAGNISVVHIDNVRVTA